MKVLSLLIAVFTTTTGAVPAAPTQTSSLALPWQSYIPGVEISGELKDSPAYQCVMADNSLAWIIDDFCHGSTKLAGGIWIPSDWTNKGKFSMGGAMTYHPWVAANVTIEDVNCTSVHQDTDTAGVSHGGKWVVTEIASIGCLICVSMVNIGGCTMTVPGGTLPEIT